MIPQIDETHDANLKSWVASANSGSDFPIQNLPFGVFSVGGDTPRGGVAIGDMILDLAKAAASGLLTGDAELAAEAGAAPNLNALLALPPASRLALRHALSKLLAEDAAEKAAVETWLVKAADATLHLPAAIGDYTDFYAGIHHALNVGRQFRPDNPLLPNYKYVPIGYHGRASSIRPSGASVRRPNGQRKAPDADVPTYGPSQRLDLELELGVWIGGSNPLGETVSISDADRYIAGLCLLNDWSARDLQAWEYQPLGPFLAKNFISTISPWIVTAEALAPFRQAQAARPEGDPAPLPYLYSDEDQACGAYAIELDVLLSTEKMRKDGVEPKQLSRGSTANLYWTLAQLVTHHASGGCNLSPGDLLGTGTISTPDDTGVGSLLELTRGGKEQIEMPNGETRAFLQDGDELILAGRAKAEGYVSIGFGECRGIIAPAPAV